jgi:hypothetical protein
VLLAHYAVRVNVILLRLVSRAVHNKELIHGRVETRYRVEIKVQGSFSIASYLNLAVCTYKLTKNAFYESYITIA